MVPWSKGTCILNFNCYCQIFFQKDCCNSCSLLQSMWFLRDCCGDEPLFASLVDSPVSGLWGSLTLKCKPVKSNYTHGNVNGVSIAHFFLWRHMQYLKKWLPWQLFWGFWVMKNMFVWTIVPPTTSPQSLLSQAGGFLSLSTSFLNTSWTFLPLLWVLYLDSPKLSFIGVKATSPLSTFICHFWHPLTHPLPLWAICNEIVNTIWIQNPSLPHIASYQLCGLGNSLNSLSLSFLPIKCGYYNACFIELSEIVHAKCLKPAKHAICFSRFYCRTLKKKIWCVSLNVFRSSLCPWRFLFLPPPPLFQALFSNLSPQPSIV